MSVDRVSDVERIEDAIDRLVEAVDLFAAKFKEPMLAVSLIPNGTIIDVKIPSPSPIPAGAIEGMKTLSEIVAFRQALRDLLNFYDLATGAVSGSSSWTPAEVLRLAEIRVMANK